MRRRPNRSPGLSRSIAAVVLAVALTVGGAAMPALARDEGTIVSLVNQARAANGLNGLVSNPALDAVALGWANQLAANGKLSHNPSVGDQIPGGWTSWGENVAQGYSSGAAVHEGWMNSPGHRANILGDFTDIGVAFIDAGSTTWGVEVFATYPGSGGAPPPVAEAPAEPEAPAEEAPADTSAAPAPPPTETPTPTVTPTPTPTASRTPTPTATAVADGERVAFREATGPAWAPWAIGIGGAMLLALILAVPVSRRALFGRGRR